MKPMSAKTQAKDLLAWYDRHKRDLPWRQNTDPYRVWLSEIMLQQTTVPTVVPYFLKFLHHYPSVFDLANAPVENIMRDWAGLGYYSRARNLHKAAQQIVGQFNGLFPETEKELLGIAGIGPYTASALLAIAFNKPYVPLDGNLERVAARLFNIATPLPQAKPELRAALAPLFTHNAGDVAQALMDLATAICTPKKPKCVLCPLQKTCVAKAQNRAEELPVKATKAEKPKRYGYVYWIEQKSLVALERRPPKGLLGGMLGLPTSAWAEKFEHPAWAHSAAETGQQIEHVFTHFHLILKLCSLKKIPPVSIEWVALETVLAAGLPTVFKKAVKAFMTGKNQTPV